MITKETRFESFVATEPGPIQKKILDTLSEPMTARQIAVRLGYTHPIAVRPRITELMKAGKIVAVGKAYDELTERNVAVFSKAQGEN